MLILAGVSINAIVGENGVLTRAQYATFLNEMASVEEAVQMWKAGDIIDSLGNKTTAIPTNGMCKTNDLASTLRLKGEIGYYRVWNISESMPTTNVFSNANDFNSIFESELVSYPAGIQDLYYLNNKECGIDDKKTYLIDAVTGMVYSMTGISLKGVNCYSSNMAKAVMNGDTTAPIFVAAEVSGVGSEEKLAGNIEPEFLPDGTKNPNYNPNGFQIIAHQTNNNVYKLYNNGDLYGKGIKGNLLNTDLSKMEEINEYIWKEVDITSGIPNVIETIPGYATYFYIDKDKNLWALGENRYNYLGLDANQQKEYTGREVIKLNVNNKKINKVIPAYSAIWVVTEDNELYVCGSNTYGQLGTGNIQEQTNKFVKVPFDNPKNIKIITQPAGYSVGVNVDYKTLILTNNGEIFFSGDTSKIYNNLFKNTEFEKTNVVQFIKIFNNIYGAEFENKIIDIGFLGVWGSQNFIMLDEIGNLYRILSNGNIELVDVNVNKFSSRVDCAVYEKNNNGIKQYMLCPLSDGKWFQNLGIEEFVYTWIDITDKVEEYFNTNSVKDFYVTDGVMFFLLNDGKVYGMGNKMNLGINETSGITEGFILIDELSSIESFICNNHTAAINGLILKDSKGKFYVTRSNNILYGNNILQGSWIKINPEGVKVKKFHACTSAQINNLAFIDDNNDIWVLGNDIRFLGINHATDDFDIHNFVRLKDYLKDTEIYNHIDGKVEDYAINYSAMYIKTNEKDENKLYVCAPYKVDSWPGLSYSGLEENQDAYIPTEVLSNVKEFVSSRNVGSVAILENNDVYIWGNNDGNTTGGIASLVPFKYEKIAGITKAFIREKACYLLTSDNKIYASGNVDNVSIACGLESSANTFTEIDSSKFNNEKIVDIAFLGTSSALFLSEKGNVFAYGNKNYLGLNTESTEQVRTPMNIRNNEDIVQVVGGPSWFILVTKDGKVYGTGQNAYGILGRWMGVGRGESNSRYKTAFSWVECPELEI